MSKRVFLLLVLTLIVSLSLTLPVQVSGASRTIVIPDNYKTLQDAVAYATTGDTIFVKKGNYTEEPFIINKSVSIVGEDANSTILILVEKFIGYEQFFEYQFPVYDYGISVAASNVTISNLTITNPRSYRTSYDSSRRCLKATGNNIKLVGNIISDLSGMNFNGSNIIIAENNLTAGDIALHGSYVTLALNNVTTTDIVAYGSNNNATLNNLVGSRLNLEGSSNIISRNSISGSLYLGGSENVVADNEVTGEGITIWGTGYERHSIISSGNSVINNDFNRTGITFRETTNSILANNSFNEGGVTLEGSSNNMIDNNRIFKGGISLEYSDVAEIVLPSSENIAKRNSIVNGSGFSLASGVGNKFFANRVENCSTGFSFIIADDNNNTSVYHNNFVNNVRQFADNGYGFTEGEDLYFYFDQGKEGNYWSDYEGADMGNDGIGDSPNVLLAYQDPGNEKPTNFTVIDRHPLMLPFDIENNKIVIPTPTSKYLLPLALGVVSTIVIIAVAALVYWKKRKR